MKFRLTEKDVAKVHALRAEGLTIADIAAKTKRSTSTIVRMVGGGGKVKKAPKATAKAVAESNGKEVTSKSTDKTVSVVDLVMYEVCAYKVGRQTAEQAMKAIAGIVA